jgi:hypothetical protein
MIIKQKHRLQHCIRSRASCAAHVGANREAKGAADDSRVRPTNLRFRVRFSSRKQIAEAPIAQSFAEIAILRALARAVPVARIRPISGRSEPQSATMARDQ